MPTRRRGSVLLAVFVVAVFIGTAIAVSSSIHRAAAPAPSLSPPGPSSVPVRGAAPALAPVSGWTNVQPPGPPPGLFYPNLAYDPVDHYLLLFGGCGSVTCGTPSSQTCEYQGGTWTQLFPSVSPPGREEAMMTWDGTDGYVLLFGGRGAAGTLSDTWAFSGGNWAPISPTASPPARSYGTLAYDPADGYSVLFGGFTCFTPCDTWTYAHGAWTHLNLSTAPVERYGASMTYSSEIPGLVLYGGVGGGGYLSDTWTFHAGAWTDTGTSGPPQRSDAQMAYDPALSAVILFGGDYVTLSNFPGVTYQDTWEYQGGAWTQLTEHTSPGARFEGNLAYDGEAGSLVLTGGCGPSGCPYSDTWVYGIGATVSVTTSPISCGSITLAGTVVPNGHTVAVSEGVYALNTTACSHHILNSVSAGGGVTIDPSETWLNVSAPGSVTLQFVIASYSVSFLVTPYACTVVSVNSTAEANNATALLPYGSYNLTAPACTGWAFRGWIVAGGVNLTSGNRSTTTFALTGNGTVWAVYGPPPPSTSSSGTLGGVPVLDLVALGLLAAAAVILAVGILTRRRRPGPPPPSLTPPYPEVPEEPPAG